MKIFNNYSLKHLNTFGVDVQAESYVEISTQDEIFEFSEKFLTNDLPFLVVGGGSNILFTKNYDGVIVKFCSSKIEVIDENPDYTFLNADAGLEWDELVKFCVSRKFGGIENLTMIPGNVGAAPIQNIGAYGQELKDVFHSLRLVELNSRLVKELMNSECNFGYRDSIFKTKLKNKVIITDVTLKLKKNPVVNIEYGNIKQEMEKINLYNPDIEDVSNIIRKIRTEKLPDPKNYGNAGSFFKNPVINSDLYHSLKTDYQDLISFEIDKNHFKIPAAWLIDKAGLKGYKIGSVGTFPNQPLVIVNYGDATGTDIYNFAMEIKELVMNKFSIELEPEVNII